MSDPHPVSATIHRYALPLTEASAAGDTGKIRAGVLLELRDEEGNSGWGEAAPLPGFSHESADDAARQLAALTATDAPTKEPYPSVRYALELARLSLGAAVSGESLSRMISPDPRHMVELSALITSGPEGALAEACRLRKAGYRAVKLKVGRLSIAEEISLVRRVADELGGVSMRLDANRAWSFDEALDFARGIAGMEVEYVEEPLSDPGLLPRFSAESGLPVALDESLAGMPTAGLGDHGYASAVVLKPTLLGGLARCAALAARAADLGMKAIVSAAFESGVGTLGLVALAAALPGDGAPAGLDTYRRLGADVLKPPLELGTSLVMAELLDAERALEPGRLEPLETAS